MPFLSGRIIFPSPQVVFELLPLSTAVVLILKYQIELLRKQSRRYLIRNFFGCKPVVELIRKGKAEQLLTKIRSVNEDRDSRSLKQQGPFLNAI